MNALLDAGHEVHYLAVTKFPIDHTACIFHRFPWPEARTDTLFFWIIFHMFAPLILILIGIKYRITHCFAFGSNYSFLLQPFRILKAIPLTLFLRSDLLHTHVIKGRPPLIIKIDHVIEGLSIMGIQVYGVSEHVTSTVLSRHKLFKPSGFGTLRNNIEKIVIRDKVSLELPLNITMIGILETLKNQELIIRCMTNFDPQTIHLDIFGSGPKEAYLKELCSQLHIMEQVTFHGWIKNEGLFANTDLLITASLQEGSPNTVLEALSRNIPILASDIPGHREILPECCLLPLTDISAWHNRLTEIFSNPDESLNILIAEQKGYAEHLVFNWDNEISSIIVNVNK